MVMASVVWLFSFWFACLSLSVMAKRTYIVQINHHQKPLSSATHDDWYSASLQYLSSSPDDLLYTYSTAYHGFAAALVPEQAEVLRKSESVLGVYEEEVYNLHTTRSPEFLGLDHELGMWVGHPMLNLNVVSQDVIIGVLDTEVWSESRSFDDSGMTRVPARWRGK